MLAGFVFTLPAIISLDNKFVFLKIFYISQNVDSITKLDRVFHFFSILSNFLLDLSYHNVYYKGVNYKCTALIYKNLKEWFK